MASVEDRASLLSSKVVLWQESDGVQLTSGLYAVTCHGNGVPRSLAPHEAHEALPNPLRFQIFSTTLSSVVSSAGVISAWCTFAWRSLQETSTRASPWPRTS